LGSRHDKEYDKQSYGYGNSANRKQEKYDYGCFSGKLHLFVTTIGEERVQENTRHKQQEKLCVTNTCRDDATQYEGKNEYHDMTFHQPNVVFSVDFGFPFFHDRTSALYST
jgi:hypothetical protein